MKKEMMIIEPNYGDIGLLWGVDELIYVSV